MKCIVYIVTAFATLATGMTWVKAMDLKVLILQQEEIALLKREGIVSYFNIKTKGGDSPPHILSRWKVGRIPGTELQIKELENLRRDYGFEIAKQMEEQAEFMLSAAPTEALFVQCDLLLRFANWLGEAPCYGNWFLAERCVDVASVGLGRAIYDLTFPADKLKPMLDRFSGAPWQTSAFRAELLNREVGSSLFAISHGTDDELSQAWARHQRRFVAWRGSAMRKAFEDGARTEEDAMLKVGLPPEEYAFFADTWRASQAPHTLVNLWDAKWHERIAVGGGSGNVALARSLLVFRLKVGRFPTHPKKPPGKNEDPAKAAFRQSWDVYRQPNNAPINSVYGGAFSAFALLRDGKFCDQDTTQIRLKEGVGD